MKILVLGNKGFFGRHVSNNIREKGTESVGLSRSSGCDLRDAKQSALRFAEIKPDAIINCAAHVGSLHYVTEYAADVIHDNLMIILGIYRAALEACPNALIVNPISNCSYPGDANKHYEPEWQDGPVHDSVLSYASPRRMIYAVSECYRKQHNMQTINWLVANAYGPGDYTDPNKVHALNGIIIRMIEAQRRGDKEFVIWGSGKPMREWVYAPDAAEILVESALDDNPPEQVYPVNIGQNKGYSIREIAEIAAKALYYPVTFKFDTSKPDGAPFKILDDRAFQKRFPDFRFTPMDEGVRNTIAYYQKSLIGL